MKFEPSGDLEKPYEFEIAVVGGAVPKNHYPAVEKGLGECVQKGPLAAPVVGVKATLYDGSYHPVDSSEQAFKTATHMHFFKEGFLKAQPVLLEPIINLKVTVKDIYGRRYGRPQ